MAIDASIYGRFAQPPRSALDYAQGFTQLGALQDQRRDNALTRAFKQREAQAAEAQAQQQNALQQFVAQQAQAGRSDQEIIQALRGRGDVAAAAQMETSYLDRQLKQADLGSKQATGRKSAADAAKTETEAVDLALGQYQGLLSRVNTPEAAKAWVQAQYQDARVAPLLPSFGPVEMALAAIPQDPQAFMQWRDQQGMGLKAYRDWMAGQARDAEAARKNQAGEALTKRGQDITVRGQNMTDSRAREMAQEARENRMVTVMDDMGNAITLPASQAAGMRAYNPQSAAQIRKQAESQKARGQLQATVNELRSYYEQLREGGGIVSEDQGALGNTMARVSSTGVGQALGGTVGTKNQQARDKIEQTRPLLLNLIKEATGMSAQQMNSNAEMQLYLRAATDPTLSYEANMQALSNLDKLFGGGLGISAAPRSPGPQLDTTKLFSEADAIIGGK